MPNSLPDPLRPTNAPKPAPAPTAAPDNVDSLAALTTAEQDRITAGQRMVNLIWERSQATIALTVTGVGMIVAGVLALRSAADGNGSTANAAFVFLTGVVNLVIGFYFGRTNHTRTGGVGGNAVKSDR